LVLEKEKTHQFNRFYLLTTILISLVLPFISFDIIKTITTETEIPTFSEELFINQTSTLKETINYTPIILGSIYGIIALLLLLRFFNNIYQLQQKSKKSTVINYQNAKIVLLKETVFPHTFLNTIFINKSDYENRTIEQELYTHELVHVNQKHSLDVLFIELLKVVFWFNPLFYFYKKAIQLNHEFLADEKVITEYNNVPFYQNLLLRTSFQNQNISLASNLNYLVTKKRLLMMTKKTSKLTAIFSKIAVLPLFTILFYFFCVQAVAQEKTAVSIEKTDNTSNKDKIRDSYYSNVRIILKDKIKNISIDKMYEELTLDEKRSYLDWVPDMKIEKEIPKELFEKMKTKNMAVWINNKTSSKEEIQKHQRTDFKYYTYSFVHKNARLKRFPQEYQYTLYTKDYFDKNLKNSHIHFGNDTIKLVISNYKKNKINEILSKEKSDTIVWTTKGKKEFNLEIKPNQKSVYNSAEIDKAPGFIGGIQAFYKFIGENYKISDEASKNKVNGKVFITFIVEKDGSLSNLKILRDIGFGTGEEAVRVLSISPKWNPGEINNEPVSVQYSLPITVRSN
jgi:beta-lactamase regulating signal transducer with metallopeptidase domain